jgi:hypothetical protein
MDFSILTFRCRHFQLGPERAANIAHPAEPAIGRALDIPRVFDGSLRLTELRGRAINSFADPLR